MGDDDIICLSSDDESITEKLPPKIDSQWLLQKSEVISKPPVKMESVLSRNRDNDLKRKIPHKQETILKKPKIVSNSLLDEISIISSENATNGESRSKPKNDESKHKAEISDYLEKKYLEKISLKSSSHSKARDCDSSNSSRNPHVRTHGSSDHKKIQSSKSNSGSHSTVSVLRSKMENIANGVRNIYAKSSQSNDSKSSTSRIPRIGEKRKIDSPKIPASTGQRIEAEKVDPLKIQTDPGASKIIEKSSDISPSVSSKSLLRIEVEKRAAKHSSMINEKSLNGSSNVLANIDDCLPVRGGNSSSLVSTFLPKERKDERIVATPKSESLKISERRSSSSTSSDRGRSSQSSKSEDRIVDANKSKTSSSRIESNEGRKKTSTNTNGPLIREISPVGQISRDNEIAKSDRLKTTNEKPRNRSVDKVSSKSAEIRKVLKNVETPKDSSSKNTIEKAPYMAERLSLKSAEIQKASKNIETPKASSLKNTIEKTSNMAEKLSSKSSDIRTTPQCSKSPEVEIVHTIETSKTLKRLISDKIANSSEKLVPKSTNGESSRESSKKSNGKISITSKILESGSPRSTPGNNSVRDENEARTSNFNSGSRESSREKSLQKIDNSTIDRVKVDGNRERKSTTDKLKSSETDSEILKKRITPQKISDLINPRRKSDESLSNVSDDEDAAQKSFKSKDQPKLKNFEPTPGCSKTPDAKSPMAVEKTRRRSSPEVVFVEESSNRDTAQEMKKSAQRSTKDEVQAGCSKSSDEQDHFEKPRLVVRAKKPVDQPQQDTFAMFLGLCLQTDRTVPMEKVVGKLKRLYEVMDPRYARSREFMDFLDEQRDKIMTRGKVYYWIGQVVEEMKLRKNRGASSKSKKYEAENNEEDENKASNDENEENEEDSEESRRVKMKIKMIDKAMKECSKRIRELEVVEVDFDDEINSNFMKLERYKEKMVELYTKMCEYTNEHADAGRAYLRPKHLRVTQIPSINQAINSFIYSKLSHNRKKGMKGKSFVDGLIFPDYVDILECVGKVNDKQNLGLNKRKQQQLAEQAFTSLGKHLQAARQQDYWDTFSLDLESNEDPAAMDSTLSKKLSENQEIAEKKTKEIFEKYVRKQDERNMENYEGETTSEADHDDDDDDDDDEDDDDNDEDEENDNDDERKVKQSSRAIESDIEESEDEENDGRNEKDEEDNDRMSESNDDHRSEKDDEDDNHGSEKNIDDDDDCRSEKDSEEDLEIIPKVPTPKCASDGEVDDEVAVVAREDDKIQENNNIMKGKLDDQFNSTERESTKNSIQHEAIEIEVNHAEVNTDDVIEAAVTETMQEPRPTSSSPPPPPPPPQPPLRIRSFAKPPSSWVNSQEVVEIPSDPETSKNTETIDVTDDEPSLQTSLKTDKFSSNLITRKSTNERDLALTSRPLIIRPTNVQSSKTDASSRMNVPISRNSSSSNPTKNITNQGLFVARSSIKIPINPQSPNHIKIPIKKSSDLGQNSRQLITQSGGKYGDNRPFRPSLLQHTRSVKVPIISVARGSNDETTSFPMTRQSVVATTTNSDVSGQSNKINTTIPRSLKVPQKIRISTSTTNPVNVRLQVVPIKESQQIRGQMTNKTRPYHVRLPNENGFATSSNSQMSGNSQSPTRSSIATGMRVLLPREVQSSRMNVSQQMRPQIVTVGNPRIINSSQAQIIRFSNGRSIRATSATFRPLDTSPNQQRLSSNLIATSANMKNPHNGPITINNPRFIKIPAAAVARSPEMSQLRIERIENLPQKKSRLSSNEISSGDTLSQIVSTGQRLIPILKPRVNENLPTTEQHKSGKRPIEKILRIPPETERPGK